MGRVVELRAGAREPEIGDRLAWDGMGWVPEVNIARPRGVTHVHTDTIVHIVMGPWRSPDFVTGVSGWQIDADGSAEFNDITARGTITATAGEIGGWTIAAGHLYAGTGANRVGLKPGTYPFYAGAEAEASAPFRVNTGGEVWATNAHITGEIDANSGHIGTLDIDGVLTVGTGTPVIQIDGPNKRIRTSDFVSGHKGWEITHEGNAEFNNLFVRGELHAVTFVADEMHATGGTLAVMTASKVADPKVATDNKLPAFIGATMILVVQASWDTGLCYVANHEVLRIKTMAEVAAGGSLDLWDIWLQVVFAPSSNGDRDLANGEPGTYDVTCVWRQGGEVDLVIPTGAAAVHWGTIATEEGGLILTSDLNYSPYMDIFTISSATPWSSGTTPHVRVGNLDGVLSLGEEWGIAAGEDLSDATKGHVVLSDQRVRLWGVAQRWWDTSGNIRGEIDPTAGSSDVLFWLGPSEAGAHFKVLGSGDVWLDTLAISGDLGDFLFSKADGLLLLGPNCKIHSTTWQSLRKQDATISGAFHQEAGRWLGTRGLMVEGGAENFITNPSFEINTTGWTDQSGGASRVSTRARVGSYSLSVTEGGSDRVLTTVAGTSGTTYTFSAWVWADTASSARLKIEANGGDYAWANLGVSSYHPGDEQWRRLTITTAALTSNTTLYCFLFVEAAGDTAFFDAVQIETRAYPTSYIDGSLDWGSWTGTAHASSSTRAATYVYTLTSGSINSNVGSVSVWFKVDTWNADSGCLWCAGNANLEFEGFVSVDGRISFRINGATRCNTDPNTVTKGDWHHAVYTWNVSSDVSKLYMDGALLATGTCGGTAPTLHTNLGIGYSTALANVAYDLTGEMGEFATFNNVLTASKVAAMYALQRPLVDAGAMDAPGIYILDGKFKMASSLTGSRIEIDADEIAGYNSGGTKQFYLRASDGAAYAGGGVVRLNADGLQIVADSAAGDPEKLRFLYDDSGTLRRQGAVYSDWAGGGGDPNVTWLQARRVSGDPWPAGVQVAIIALDTIVGTDVRIAVNSSKVVDVTGEDIFKTEKLLRPGTGTSDPTLQVEDGCLFYRTDTDKLRLRANGAWVNLN